MSQSFVRAGVLAIAVFVPLYSSCADDGDEADTLDSSPPPTLLDGGLTDGDPTADGGQDADCKEEAPGCRQPTCDEVDWCPVQTGLDGRIALAAIWGSSRTDVWAVGSAGTIVHFDGNIWKTVPSGIKQSLHAVWGSAPDDVWITSTPGVTLHGGGYENGTASWSIVTPPISDYKPLYTGSIGKIVTAVWGFSADNVWFAGETFARSGAAQENQWRTAVVDGGTEFRIASNCPKGSTGCPNVNALWGSSPSNIWAVGVDGLTMHADGTSGDGGAPTWTALDSKSTANLSAVWGHGNTVWTVGSAGTIRRSVLGAARWEEIASPTTSALHGLWGTSADDIWAVGENGTVLHYDGSEWSASSVSFPARAQPHLNAVWGSGADDVWIVGDGVVLHFTGHKAHAEDGSR